MMILLCSLLMRIKGGGPAIAPKWFLDMDGSWISSILFTVLCMFFFPWWQAILCGLAWFLNIMSMGEEAGAIGGFKGNWYTDRDSWFGSEWFGWIKNNKLWGWASSSVRGIVIGSAVSLATLNPWFILAFAAFPLAYFIGISIEQARTGQVSVGWNYGEWIYGAIIGIPFMVYV